MSKWMKIAALALAASFAFAPAGFAAKAKKPVKKPAVKVPVKPAPHIVLGTTQLSGENAKFGLTYTLGKSDPLNVIIRSAEYTIDPVKIGEDTYLPNAEEKLLVLHLTYHNPQKAERFVRWDTFVFTVVDPQSQNHDGLMALGSEQSKETAAMNMKPAQKVDFYGVMTVPAKAEMPKLMIKSSDDFVLRYDLKDKEGINKVKPLPVAYADPADPSGYTALEKIKGAAGTSYPVGMFSFKFDKAELSSATKMGDSELSEGEKFYVVTISLKNISAVEQFFRWDVIETNLVDSDGIALGGASDLFQSSKDKSFSSNISTGQELTLRYIFKVTEDTDIKTFTATAAGGGRTFEFDVK
ncbi:MAG: hypothetical protein NT018_10130 [Armatimonadetes bacterium]|nr:hypothetical protein [Armatimonadota bacterium]